MSTISDRKFVSAWVDAYNENRGVTGVANKLSISKTQASAKASNLRKQGVKLPSMPLGVREYSVESLNNIITSRVK